MIALMLLLLVMCVGGSKKQSPPPSASKLVNVSLSVVNVSFFYYSLPDNVVSKVSDCIVEFS